MYSPTGALPWPGLPFGSFRHGDHIRALAVLQSSSHGLPFRFNLEGPLRNPGERKSPDSQGSLLQNSSGSGIYCREELLSLGARASRPHKTWQGRGDWLHRVGRFTCRLALEQRLDKYAGGTPALPGGNPWLARCRSLSRVLFCRSILPPSHARLRILQKAQGLRSQPSPRVSRVAESDASRYSRESPDSLKINPGRRFLGREVATILVNPKFLTHRQDNSFIFNHHSGILGCVAWEHPDELEGPLL